MFNNLPLRERKKYQTMSSILNEFLTSLESNHFNEIHIEDVCKKVSISKVTFFRYFNSKEEVLDYFVMRWCYQRSVEISNEIYAGIEGIRQVFRSAAEIPNAEKILVSLIHYYSKLKDKPAQKELSEYERYIISQNSTEGIHVKILSIDEIIHVYLSQIKNLSESSISLFTDHLVALFYGIPFQVHMQKLGSQSLLKAYMDSLDILFSNDNIYF
jgi:AcrR family transcriptional regulator